MKRILFTFLLLVCSTVLLNAQKSISEGRVVYEITYPDMELDSRMAAMLPSESVVYFKNNKSRTETSMGMGMNSASIADSKTGNVITLMDMMGNKMAMKMTEAEFAKYKEKSGSGKVEETGETKTIAGYECKKAVVKIDDAHFMDFYYTDKINSKLQFNQQFAEIKGFPMEYFYDQNGMRMKMTAKSVTEEKIADSMFEIPAGYEIKSMDEVRKMMDPEVK